MCSETSANFSGGAGEIRGIVIAFGKKLKGYPPNSWLTMVRKPKVFRAYRDLHTAVMIDEGAVPKALKFMIAEVVSMAAGDPSRAARLAQSLVHDVGDRNRGPRAGVRK